MIKVQITDSIVDIIEKIESQSIGDIILDFPLGHPILHNYISLKILKSKVVDRKLIVATNDRIGKKIGKRLGIEYSAIKNTAFIQENTNSELLQHNFSFWEYFRFQVRNYVNEVRRSIDTNKKLNSLGRYSKVYQEKTSLHIFIGVLLFASMLFIFIYYFAISKTYIYITPEILIKKEAHNFIFKENIENSILGNNKYIKIKNIGKKIQSQSSYSSTDIVVSPQNISRGEIKIFNFFDSAQNLIAGTRFQTETGIIFTSKSPLHIPPASIDNFKNVIPGHVTIEVISQIKDFQGKYIGSRGNINNNTSLFLPALDQETRNNIYAVSINDFSGGSDAFKKKISQKDLDIARDLFTEKLRKNALEQLKQEILEENLKNNTSLEILSGGKSITYSDAQILYSEGTDIGVEKDDFHLSGSITIQAYVYNKGSIIQKLQTLISEKNLEGVEKISQIDTSSLRASEIIYIHPSPFEMKATFEIEALLLHDFLHDDNTYISKLKKKVQGIKKSDAEKILLNDPRISNVKIEIRPFFIDHVSSIFSNIIFKLK